MQLIPEEVDEAADEIDLESGDEDKAEQLLSLLEDESQLEQNISLIYRHISFRASKILQSKNIKAFKALGKTAVGGGGTGRTKKKVMASFGLQDSELIVAAPSVRRANSFKLGPRPREMKDKVRKEYRRNSIHLESGAAFTTLSGRELESEAEESAKGGLLAVEREQEVINLQDVQIVPIMEEEEAAHENQSNFQGPPEHI